MSSKKLSNDARGLLDYDRITIKVTSKPGGKSPHHNLHEKLINYYPAQNKTK